jgi:hypothetical protein
MVHRTQRLLQRWRSETETDGGLEEDAERAMTGLTLEIAAKTFFDAAVSGETDELGRAVAILSCPR